MNTRCYLKLPDDRAYCGCCGQWIGGPMLCCNDSMTKNCGTVNCIEAEDIRKKREAERKSN